MWTEEGGEGEGPFGRGGVGAGFEGFAGLDEGVLPRFAFDIAFAALSISSGSLVNLLTLVRTGGASLPWFSASSAASCSAISNNAANVRSFASAGLFGASSRSALASSKSMRSFSRIAASTSSFSSATDAESSVVEETPAELVLPSDGLDEETEGKDGKPVHFRAKA